MKTLHKANSAKADFGWNIVYFNCLILTSDILLPKLLGIFLSSTDLSFSFFSMGWYCGVGVSQLIGCASLSPCHHCRPLLKIIRIRIIIIKVYSDWHIIFNSEFY